MKSTSPFSCAPLFFKNLMIMFAKHRYVIYCYNWHQEDARLRFGGGRIFSKVRPLDMLAAEEAEMLWKVRSVSESLIAQPRSMRDAEGSESCRKICDRCVFDGVGRRLVFESLQQSRYVSHEVSSEAEEWPFKCDLQGLEMRHAIIEDAKRNEQQRAQGATGPWEGDAVRHSQPERSHRARANSKWKAAFGLVRRRDRVA